MKDTREIKYRQLVNGKWHYWGFFNLNAEETVFVAPITRTDNKIYPSQQFTGLILRGKEVYAGDIISFPDTESEYVDTGVGDMKVAETNVRGWGEVVFKNYSWGLEINMSCESVEKGFTSFAELLDIFEEQDLEIIGNKFEQPELLK